MVASMEGSHLRYRDASLKKTAAMSVENKLVVDEYIRCWQDLRHNPSPKCALESAAMGRSQGRTEAQVSVLLGNMGIFEQGCIRTDTMDLIAVLANDELKGLMGKWCSGKTR